MADKPKKTIVQDTQEAQDIQEAAIKKALKKRASDRVKQKAVKFANRETGEVKNVFIDLPNPEEAIYLEEIDPESPNYSPEKAEKYRKQLQEQGKNLADLYADMNKRLETATKSIISTYNSILKQAQFYDKLQELAAALLTPELEELAALLPYMEKLAAGPEYKQYGSDLETILDTLEAQGTDQDGHIIPGSAWDKLINEARAAREQDKVKTTAKRAETLEFPLDKVNSTVWGLLEKDTQGQIALKAERAGTEPLNIFYSINFDALENVHISKRLTAFDKTVYVAAAALFNAGNEWITLTQIYYAMGNDRNKKPASKHLEKILDSLRKMKAADIFIDNAQEAGKYNYPTFKYEGDLLPTEKITATINGKLTDAAIHLFREPPLVTFAKQRNQVTTISVKLLAAPINKTEKHLAIQDYLLERISRAKHGTKKQERILFAKLAEKAKDTTGKKGRIQEAAETYLKHFKAEAWIKNYTTDKDGITIYF